MNCLKRKEHDNYLIEEMNKCSSSSSSSPSNMSSLLNAPPNIKKSCLEKNVTKVESCSGRVLLLLDAIDHNIQDLLERKQQADKKHSAHSTPSLSSLSSEDFSHERKIKAEESYKTSEEIEQLAAQISELDLNKFNKVEELYKIKKIFISAIHLNELNVVENFIKKGFEVDSLNAINPHLFREKSLHQGIAKANPAIVKKLLAEGLLLKGMNSSSLLNCALNAIKEKDSECFEALIKRGVTLNPESENASIFEEFLFNNFEMAQIVLKKQEFALPVEGKHYFLLALERGRFDIAQFIAEKDLNFNQEETHRSVLAGLQNYVSEGNEKIVKFCVKECKINTKMPCLSRGYGSKYFEDHRFIENKFFFLAEAIRMGHTSLAPLLAIDQRNVSKNMFAYLELVLQKGTLREFKKLESMTNQFLALGADVNFTFSKDPQWNITLFSRCFLEIFKYKNRLSPPQITALLKYMIFLAEKGANIHCHLKNCKDNTLSLIFSEKLFMDEFISNIAYFIKKEVPIAAGGPTDPALATIFKNYLKFAVDTDENRKSFFTEFLLMYPNRQGYNHVLSLYLNQENGIPSLSMMEEIREMGGDLNAPIFNGKPFLYAALDLENIGLVNFLLQNHAALFLNLHAVDERGFGFFSYAIPYQSKSFEIEEGKIINDFMTLATSAPTVSQDIFLGLCKASNPIFLNQWIDIATTLELKFKASLLKNFKEWESLVTPAAYRNICTAFLYQVPASYSAKEIDTLYSEEQKKEIAQVNILSQLEKIYSTIDFSKHLLPYKEESTDRLSKEEMLEKFKELVITRLITQPAVVGVPKKYENDQDKTEGIVSADFIKFYQNIENLLQEILYNFNKKMTSEPDLEGQSYQFILELLYIFKRCGGQWEGGLGELCIAYGIGPVDFESSVRAHLCSERHSIFKSTISEIINLLIAESAEPEEINQYLTNEVHLYNYLLRTYGTELGLPRWSKTTEGTTFLDCYPLDRCATILKDAFKGCYGSNTITTSFNEILTGKHSSHLFEKEIMEQAIKNQLLGEWKLKEYMERIEEIKENLHKFFASQESKPSFGVLWNFMKEEAERCKKGAVDPIDNKQVILIDYIKSNVESILSQESAQTKIFTSICERLDFAAQMTRRDDYSTQIFDENDGSFKPNIPIEYLAALNLITKRTDIIDWNS